MAVLGNKIRSIDGISGIGPSTLRKCIIDGLNKNIINKEFNDNVIYSFYLNEDELSLISELEKVAINVVVKDKVLINKD